jgi:hypothetical protein
MEFAPQLDASPFLQSCLVSGISHVVNEESKVQQPLFSAFSRQRRNTELMVSYR